LIVVRLLRRPDAELHAMLLYIVIAKQAVVVTTAVSVSALPKFHRSVSSAKP
jgi:hypothetical protein